MAVNLNTVSHSLSKPQVEPWWIQSKIIIKLQTTIEAVIETETKTTAVQLRSAT